MSDRDRARSALRAIDPGCRRETWVQVAMAAKSAGISLDDFTAWSKDGHNFKSERDCADVWKSIHNGGITEATLYDAAIKQGWTDPAKSPMNGHRRRSEKSMDAYSPKPGTAVRGSNAAIECWERFHAATAEHSYIIAKHGRPDGLRFVPDDDPLTIRGVPMVGWLVVPVRDATGTMVSLQFISPSDIADRLKANGIRGKLNFPGASMAGTFIVGELEPGATVYVTEGIGTAWACWKATGRPAVVCFGWGMVKARAAELRARDPSVTVVIVPDVGKEAEAEKIARDVCGSVAAMPEGWPTNADLCDLC